VDRRIDLSKEKTQLCGLTRMSPVHNAGMLKHIFSRIATFSFVAATALSPLATAQSQSNQTPDPVRLPPVVVSVYNEPQDVQTLPVSLTGVSETTLNNAGITKLSDAEMFAPNTFFLEYSARKSSNARFRGIGSDPFNPGIITYIDGVPQLNANSANIEFMDIEQVEFVRAPQNAFFGRNTLGGMIGVTSRKPSMSEWRRSVTIPIGNYSDWDAQLSASGPLTDNLAVGLTLGRSQSKGFTVNDVSGRVMDRRKLTYGKVHFWWTPTSEWDARLIVTGESARDGDNGLNDLNTVRRNPFHVERDFEGFMRRDILSSTLLTQRSGDTFSFSTITGVVRWKSHDATDLDYSLRPLFTRDDTEKDLQLTQEVRLASGATPIRLTDNVIMRWQTGVFFLSQKYNQDAATSYPPYLLLPQLGVPSKQHLPLSELTDLGLGVYGQGTATFGEDFDLTFGMRLDNEKRKADLTTSYDPSVVPATTMNRERTFTSKSPMIGASYRLSDGRMLFGSFGRGYKPGGFNGGAPIGAEGYEEEKAWHFEGGLKALFADGRWSTNVTGFYIDWTDMQMVEPNPITPAQTYITTVGAARTEGVEFDLNARPHQKVDIFTTMGMTRARFVESANGGMNLSGRILPYTPGFTFGGGSQVTQPLLSGVNLYGRGEIKLNSGFEYNAQNSQRQTAYSLVSFRGGLRGQTAFGEFWMTNAFDTRYIPVAFAYNGFTSSGFLAEMGAPRRYGIRLGLTF